MHCFDAFPVTLCLSEIATRWHISRRTARTFVDRHKLSTTPGGGRKVLVPLSEIEPFDAKWRERACPACGKTFEPHQFDQVYCSRCSRRGGLPPRPEELKCAFCGETFKPRTRRDEKYCSRKCRNGQFYKAHHDRVLASKAQWKKNHPEQTRKDANKYRERYPEKIKENNRKQGELRRAAIKAFRAKPTDWDDRPIDWRIIATELLSVPGYMSNATLAVRLDRARLLGKCPYGDSWEIALSSAGRAANYISEIRKWVRRPGNRPGRAPGRK
jgi:hypothetical protein